MKFIPFALILALAGPAALAEVREVALPGGRKVAVTLERIDDQLEWLVFLPGSICDIVDGGSRPVSMVRNKRAYNLLIINKAGVSQSGKCDQAEYNRASVRSQRIQDIQAVMKSSLSPDAKILLMGESEGGYIAPDIALADKRIESMILISAGTRSWIDEEIAMAPEDKREATRRFLQQEVRGRNVHDKFFNGWSYAQLNSYDTTQTYDALKAIKIPVLAINGAHDTQTWVEATREDLEFLIQHEGKSNIEFHYLKDADHGLNCASPGCDEAAFEKHLCGLILSGLPTATHASGRID